MRAPPLALHVARAAALLWSAAVVLTASGSSLAQERTQAAPGPGDTQVVIKGTRVRPRVPPKDRSVAGSMIQGARLAAPGKKAAELLRGEPGVSVAETGGQGALATASIRGATSAQTPVYLAGVRLNDDVAGSADLSLIPLWLIQRVEVYRGHAPLEADQLGIGGAVFFEPKRPRKLEIGAGGQVGSFGSRGAWAWGSHGNDASGLLVGASWDRARNDYPYTDDRGTRFESSDDVGRRRTNADARTVEGWAVGTASTLGEGRVDVVINAVSREQGLPGLALIPTQAARARSSRVLGAVSASVPCDDRASCLVRMTSSALLAGSTLLDPLRELGLSATRADLYGRRVDQSASVRVDLGDSVTLVPSLRASVERLLVDADGAASVRASRGVSRGAMAGEWRASRRWTFRALGSGECQGTSLGGLSLCSRVSGAGRAGAELSLGALSLLGNVGHYERVPTLAELYGLAGAVRGNSSLTPEQGNTGELGARVSWGGHGAVNGAYADVFAFARTAADLIAWRRSAAGYVRPYNVSSARVLGVELLASAGFGGFLDVELSATMLDPRDTSGSRTVQNDILPFRSRLTASPSARLHTDAWAGAGVDEASLEARYTHQSSRYADSAGLVVIAAQGSLDLESSVTTLDKHLTVRARLSDALDQARYDIIGYPLLGRTWFGAMELSW